MVPATPGITAALMRIYCCANPGTSVAERAFCGVVHSDQRMYNRWAGSDELGVSLASTPV